jgi:hypothetical protein
MKIISLSSSIAGPACSIACSIKKHFYTEPNSYPTNIFDYLEISFNSIIQILNTNNIESLLNNNYEIFPNNDNKNSIKFNNFEHLISHHDLSNNYNETEFYNIIDKYKRRYYRLINEIKTQDKIFFIRYGYENIENFIIFKEVINKINPDLKIHYFNIIYDSVNNIQEIFNEEYTLINFHNYIDITKNYSENLFFKLMEIDWNIIYKIISINLTEDQKKKLIYV